MPVEVATNFEQLDNTQPLLGDGLDETGAHLRQLKRVLKDMFPGAAGQGYAAVINATEDEIDYTIGLTANVQTELTDIIANGVIVSGFIPYSGLFASIPTGWQLCDGTNGTPDLANSFIYGTNTQSEINVTGGSADAQVISHSHTMNHNHSATIATDGAHLHILPSANQTYQGLGAVNMETNRNDVNFTQQTDTNANHNHTITTSATSFQTDSAGGSAIGANTPAYIRLAYIMRIS